MRSFEGHVSLVIRMVIDANMQPVIDGVYVCLCVTVESLSSELSAALVSSGSMAGLFPWEALWMCMCACGLVPLALSLYEAIKYDYTPSANQTHKWQDCFDYLPLSKAIITLL